MHPDYNLGKRFSEYILKFKSPTHNQITALIQDLIGADQTLFSPLQDLVAQPAFQKSLTSKSLANTDILRDSLLLSLKQTYNQQIIDRLRDFLNGYFESLSLATAHERQANADTAEKQNVFSSLPGSRPDQDATIVESSSVSAYRASQLADKSTHLSQYQSLQASVITNNRTKVDRLLYALVGFLGGGILIALLAIIILINRNNDQPLIATTKTSTQSSKKQNTESNSNQQREQTERKPSLLEDDKRKQADRNESLHSPNKRRPEASVVLIRQDAKNIVQQWLNLKSQIFAPPYSKSVANGIVASGPLWRDLTRTNGSITWLKANNSYYTYPVSSINNVLSFVPSATRPSIVLSIRETSIFHSPKGKDTSTSTNVWVYTFSKENQRWKIWDYKKR